MITNKGKNILAKYLIGQSQSYASHIALGVGPRPLSVGQSIPDFSNQEQLEFEVLRTPITSRGFVYDEDGNPNVVFVAEIPSEQRYVFSEVGVYPGRSNPSAQGLESRSIYTFGIDENWEYHTESATLNIREYTSPLSRGEGGGEQQSIIVVPDIVFRSASNNVTFLSSERQARYENPRFLSTSLLMRGDLSFLTINGTSGNLEINPSASTYAGSHIHYNGISLNLDSNSAEDELRMAFSIVNKLDTQAENVQSVRILVEFINADVPSPTNFAKFEVIINESGLQAESKSFQSNRYFVVKKKFSELIKSSSFTWNAVNSVRIYATVLEVGSSAPSDNFYVCLDGLRFENVTTQNPLYGLTGYSVVRTSEGLPITKENNTSSSVEFRFALGVE